MVSAARLLSIAAVAVLLSAVPAGAQAQNGRIRGTVRDAHSVPMAGATVRVTGGTGAARRATSDADGAFSFTNVAPGTYTVSASLPGVRTQVQQGVRVAADAEAVVNFVLQALEMEAITVTAMKREEQLLNVPISIAAPTEQALRVRGVDNIEEVAQNVAGFSVQNLGPGQSQPAIRGASSGQISRDQPGVKEEVGAYLDESVISLSLFTPDLDLFDVGRVEVLRGPQGTLFGSGSLSGTVRYISNQPELGISKTFGEAEVTEIDGGEPGSTAKLGFNAPLGDKAAARIVGYSTRTGGYMDAVQPNLRMDQNVNGNSRAGLRAAIRLQPNSKFSITPRLVYQRAKADGWNRIDAYNILANPYTTTRPKVTLGERQLFTQIEEPVTDKFLLGDVNLQVDLGAATLTSVSSYTHRNILVVRDATALYTSIVGGSFQLPENIYTLDAPLYDHTNSIVWTQEVRLAGSAQNQLKWLVGAFYSNNKRGYGQDVFVKNFDTLAAPICCPVLEPGLPPPPQPDGWTMGPLLTTKDHLFFSDLNYKLTQTAVFGEATFSATPKLDLTGGLRWYNFDENRAQAFDGFFVGYVTRPGKTKANGLAPRFIANYKASDALTFNAQASRGFRLGGINDPLNKPICSPADTLTFGGRDSWKDETAWNYEAGMKSRLWGGRGSVNLSAFYMKIDNLQLNLTAGTCSSRLVFNVDKAKSQGLELEVTASPNEHWDLAFSTGFNDAKLLSTVTTTDTAGVTTVVGGVKKGNRLPSVPKVQASAAITYGMPIGISRLSLTGSFQYVGSRYTQIDDLTPGIDTVHVGRMGQYVGGQSPTQTFVFDPLLAAYSLFNLRAGLSRGGWEAAFFVNNVTDERAFLALDRERGLNARVGYLTNQPRTFGLSLRFDY